jgi:hypothetical protein
MLPGRPCDVTPAPARDAAEARNPLRRGLNLPDALPPVQENALTPAETPDTLYALL